MIVFKYKQESLGQPNQIVWRPVADIHLLSRSNNWIEFHPYIDSGADLTLIPLSLGKLLGLSVISGKEIREVRGVRGTVPTIHLNNQIKIGQLQFSTRIAWALTEEVPPLLGRIDIFDHFIVTFKQQEKAIFFEHY